MRLEEILKREPGVYTQINYVKSNSIANLIGHLFNLQFGKLNKFRLTVKDLYGNDRSFDFICEDRLIGCDIVGRGDWICRGVLGNT